MKEAMLYEKLGDGRVKCGVCPHHCVIAEGKRGICAVRENREGTLYALNYGKAIAVAIDPIEKKPLNYFLPGTTAYSFATIGCNLRCLWCQNWAISQASKPNRLIYGEDISPDEHVRRALAAGCPSIAYTYTEPIIFVEYALDTMKLAREAGLKNIWKTAGYATKETLDTIIRFHESGVHLEIATLIVPGVNDRIDQLERMARFIAEEVGKEVPWHVNRFFPGWKMMDTAITPMETFETAAALGKKSDCCTCTSATSEKEGSLMLVFGVISPHPPLIIPEIGGKDIERVKRTVAALEMAAERLAAAKPDRLLLISPHEGHGFEVPMHYLDRQLPPNLETEKILVTVPSYEHYYEWAKRYGEAYDRSDLRTAIIASSDLSHVLKPEGPYGYHSAGPLFDKLVVKAIKEKDAGQLLRLDAGFLERAAECGLRSILFLMGAFEGRAYEAEVLSYEGPFGIGYLVATFMPSESEEQIKDA